MIYKDGYKMSKSRGNVVSPDYICGKYGADTGRAFILFIGPPDQDAEWNDAGVEGVFRFLNRVWRFFDASLPGYDPDWRSRLDGAELNAPEREMRRMTHHTIERITNDIERFHFNTAVSALMEMTNALYEFGAAEKGEYRNAVASEAMENMALILAPFVPHVADELWEAMGKSGTTYEQNWPAFDPELTKAEMVEMVIQINGKVRDRLELPAEIDAGQVEELALASDRVQKLLEGRPPRKVIVVPGKLVNIVV